jgi:hypothetical protein
MPKCLAIMRAFRWDYRQAYNALMGHVDPMVLALEAVLDRLEALEGEHHG